MVVVSSAGKRVRLTLSRSPFIKDEELLLVSCTCGGARDIDAQRAFLVKELAKIHTIQQ